MPDNNPFATLPDWLTQMPAGQHTSRVDTLSNMLISLGAGITDAGSRGRGFLDGIAPGAMMFAKNQGEQQQQDEARQLRNWQIGLQAQGQRDKEDERRLKLAGMAAAAKEFEPQPGMRAPAAPLMGPGNYGPQVANDESGGSYAIANQKGSGAYGKYQFMPDTWADVAKNHPELNLPFDLRAATPQHQEAAMAALTADNTKGLETAGFSPTPDNLYLAHRFGVNGAGTMLRADPNDPVKSLYPAQWTAQNPDMEGKTVGQFRQGVQQRYAPTEAAPPTITDVPRPALPEEDRARLQRMIQTGAITPEQALQEKNRIVDGLWSAQRDVAGKKYQQDSETYRFNRGQTFEKEKFQRGLETEGEWVRGADGVERFTPKSQRGAGMPRADKPHDAGSETGDIQVLNSGDPASREYLAAFNRIKTKLIDGPNGLKYAPDVSAYRAPTFAETGAAPGSAVAVPGSPAGLTPIGDRSYTETQNKDHTYAMRLANSIPELEKLLRGDDGKYNTANVPSSREHMMGDSAYVPEAMINEKTKTFRQLEKDILTATLRRESGASISSSEFVSERAKFIPMPGDSEAGIRRKLKALKIAAKTFTEGTGRPASTYGSAFDFADDAKPATIKIDMSGNRR